MKKLLVLLSTIFFVAFSDGEKHCYVKVTKSWYEQNKGYTKGANVLSGGVDTLGNYYISINTYNEFPELFESKSSATLYWLYPNAFVKDSIDVK